MLTQQHGIRQWSQIHMTYVLGTHKYGMQRIPFLAHDSQIADTFLKYLL